MRFDHGGIFLANDFRIVYEFGVQERSESFQIFVVIGVHGDHRTRGHATVGQSTKNKTTDLKKRKINE